MSSLSINPNSPVDWAKNRLARITKNETKPAAFPTATPSQPSNDLKGRVSDSSPIPEITTKSEEGSPNNQKENLEGHSIKEIKKPKESGIQKPSEMKSINRWAVAAMITFVAIIIIAIVVSVLGAKGYLAPLAKAKIWGVINNGLVNGYHGTSHFFVHTTVGRVVGSALLGAAAISTLAIAYVGLKALFGKKAPKALPNPVESKDSKTLVSNDPSSTPQATSSDAPKQTKAQQARMELEKAFGFDPRMDDNNIVRACVNKIIGAEDAHKELVKQYKDNKTRAQEVMVIAKGDELNKLWEAASKDSLFSLILAEYNSRISNN